MKAKNVYVGINGAALDLGLAGRGIAVYPVRKGEDCSHVLLSSGKVARMKGSRINGLGVARYLSQNGFELAQPGDKNAERLADEVDVIDSIKLVEAAANDKADELQRLFAGKTCTFVPFDETKASAQVTLNAPDGFLTICADLVDGFSAGNVKIEYRTGSTLSSQVALSAGWLVGPDGDVSNLPRNKEYGGPLERAMYILCNSGLAALVGNQNLLLSADPDYPRGMMEVALENGDRLRLVIVADEPVVIYIREGEVLYTRTGMYGTRLRDAVGAIAAVLVRVAELDAQKVKRTRKKAA
jgi:hypothetical protein